MELLKELTHGTFAITGTSDLNSEDVIVGEKYTYENNPNFIIVSKSKNHFKIRNTGSSKTFGIAYKGKEELAKKDYYDNNTKYIQK